MKKRSTTRVAEHETRSRRAPERSAAWKWLAAAIVVGVCLVYAQTLGFGFLNFDDDVYVANNEHVRDGVSLRALSFLTTHSYASNWHPLTWLSHMLDVQLFGMSPGAHHAVNVLLHAANAALLFALLFLATRELLPAFFVAAVFAVHPLQVESVAWIAERKNVLSTLLLLVTIALWARWRARRTWTRYAAVIIVFIAGLAAKPMLVTLPVLLVLIDLWPLRSLTKKSLLDALPLFIISGVSCVVTVLAQSAGGAVADSGTIPLAARVSNALASVGWYIWKAVWPGGLLPFYPHPLHIGERVSAIEVLGGSLLLAGMLAAAWYSRVRAPYVTAGVLWYLVSLGPVIGIIQVGAQAHADRYAYVPLIGFWCAVAWTVSRSVKAPHLASAVAMVAVVAYGFAAFRYAGKWRDSVTLFSYATENDDRNYLAWNNLGMAIVEREPQRAFTCFANAMHANGHCKDAIFNYGVTALQLGDLRTSVDTLRHFVELDPEAVRGWVAYGDALRIGGDTDAALKVYAVAARRHPADPGVLARMAATCAMQGRRGEAMSWLSRLRAVDPVQAASLEPDVLAAIR